MEDKNKESEKERPQTQRNRSSEYIANIVVNIILVAIWSRLPEWIPFLTESFNAILPLFYISFGLTIFANLILLANDVWFVAAPIKVLLNIVSIIVMISLYYIFPFDFSAYQPNWETIVRVLILVSIFGILVGTIVESIKTVSGSDKL